MGDRLGGLGRGPHFSPESGAVVDRVPVAVQPGSLATGDGAVWVASTLGGAIERIDPATGAAAPKTVRLGGRQRGGDRLLERLALGRGHHTALARRDRPENGHGASLPEPRPDPRRPGRRADGAAPGGRFQRESGRAGRLDLRREVATVRAGNGPAALAGAPRWPGMRSGRLRNSLDSTVSRINARSGTVEAMLSRSAAPRRPWRSAAGRSGSRAGTRRGVPASTRARTA